MKGVVERIWHNHEADGSENWVLSIGGQRYGTWNRELVDQVSEGDEVEYIFAQGGRCRRLTALARTGQTGFVTANRLAARDDAMRQTRSDSLCAAVTLVSDVKLPLNQRAASAVALAHQLEAYLLRGGNSRRKPAPSPGGRLKRPEGKSRE